MFFLLLSSQNRSLSPVKHNKDNEITKIKTVNEVTYYIYFQKCFLKQFWLNVLQSEINLEPFSVISDLYVYINKALWKLINR